VDPGLVCAERGRGPGVGRPGFLRRHQSRPGAV